MKVDFLIIDTYNMIVRAKTPWTKVEDKNLIVLSFLRMFKKVICDFNPEKVIMPLDDYIGNNFRRKIFPEYKINRKQKNNQDSFTEEFKKQKDIILDLLSNKLPVYTLKYKGYEADDIISMICRIASDDVNIVVWSNDKDLIQLQQKIKNVQVYSPHKKNFFDSPDYDIAAFKSLVGDRSDNIPGVRGIGKKTAEKVLSSHRDFMKYVSSRPSKYVQYRINRRIIDLLENDLPIPNNLHYILSQKVDYDEVYFINFISDNKFKSIMKNINEYNNMFLDLREKSLNQKEWFFNKKETVK
ncbi:MAG: 5'-3' exonuclease H3TH domain-containing protein [Bacillota bacterium]